MKPERVRDDLGSFLVSGWSASESTRLRMRMLVLSSRLQIVLMLYLEVALVSEILMILNTLVWNLSMSVFTFLVHENRSGALYI
jgi:hypothetical protein